MSEGMALVGSGRAAGADGRGGARSGQGRDGCERLRLPPVEVVSFLEALGRPVRAVYEAGPTGFGLARAARERGLDVRVVAPGSIPKGRATGSRPIGATPSGSSRLLAAGELSFVFVPAVADECFRDLVRCIEDVREDLMRARHRLWKFLLRRGCATAARARLDAPAMRWLGSASSTTPLAGDVRRLPGRGRAARRRAARR